MSTQRWYLPDDYAEIAWKIVKTYHITTIVNCIVNKTVNIYHIHIPVYCNVAKSVKIR